MTENRQAYDQLVKQLVREWQPRNITEWTFVRDIADISWEIFRHRRAIAGVFAISFKEALAGVFIDVLPGHRRSLLPEDSEALRSQFRQAEALADAWFEGPEQQEQVKSELAEYGVTADAVVAQTYSVRGDVLDKLHRLLALAEARRTAIARNFNEYRAMTPPSDKPRSRPQRGRPGAEFRLRRHANRKTNCRQPAECAAQHRPAHPVG